MLQKYKVKQGNLFKILIILQSIFRTTYVRNKKLLKQRFQSD
jgi:hypothetical protein